MSATDRQSALPGRRSGVLVSSSVYQLRPHPAYATSGISVSAAELSALIGQGEIALQEPLLITREFTIIEGYDRWELAKQQKRPTLPCIQYELPEEEALLWLLRKLRPMRGVNNFCRILLALALEPSLKERAHANQRLGGMGKGSSNLTEVDRLDVRAEIADAAGVSTGNVSKVKHIMENAQPELLLALRTGEVSIHRAWRWLADPEHQLSHLALHRDQRGITKTVNALLRGHRFSAHQEQFDPDRLVTALAELDSEQRANLLISEVKVSGEVLLLSPALCQTLTKQGRLIREAA